MRLDFVVDENALNNNQEPLRKRYREILNQIGKGLGAMAEKAAPKIEELYSVLSDEDLSDLTVNSEPVTETAGQYLEAAVTAKAEKIVFAEFGAGTATGSANSADTIRNLSYEGVNVYPGSWSESDQGTGQFAKHGFWTHNGETYEKVEPVGAMTDIMNEWRADMRQYFTEVGKT